MRDPADFVQRDHARSPRPITYATICARLASKNSREISRGEAKDAWEAVVASIGYCALRRESAFISLELPPSGHLCLTRHSSGAGVFGVCSRTPLHLAPRVLLPSASSEGASGQSRAGRTREGSRQQLSGGAAATAWYRRQGGSAGERNQLRNRDS